MISSEPEPDRTPRPALQRPVVTITWTPAARREYSRLAALHSRPQPTRAQLNALAKKAIRQTLHQATFKIAQISELENPTFALDVSFVSDEEIGELNSAHRGKNKPTDVLSWSQLEGEWMPSGKGTLVGDEEILLGDLVISIETAARQATELKHGLKHEMAFLVAHGVLHLCGYDHDTDSRRRAMFKLQDEIVLSLEMAQPAG